MGNVFQAGLGQNPARQSALAAGIPDSVPATTVNKLCGSGLKAVTMAAQAIVAGDDRVVVAGGMENMSLAPHLLPAMRAGQRMGDAQAIDREITPVSVPAPRGDPVVVDRDEHPRPQTTLEGLARLRPSFASGGTVTAGSSPGIETGPPRRW